MPDVSDMELLRDYHRQGSEEAFAELVRRHLNLVYSVALRHVGIVAHAEEITQAVFVILARKAAGLRADTILEGWLHETTRLTALSFLRGERRRQFREQEAYMQSALQESADASAWNQLAPLLDEAVSRLGKKDRDAVMLRFFKDESLREVAAALRVSEAAAQRRVLRALEKLRKFFAKRGVVSTTAIIAGAVSANSVQVAPVALAKSVTAVAITKGAAASGSTLTLIKGALKIMAWTKAKTVVVIGAAAILAASTATVIVKTPFFSPIKDSCFQPNYRHFQNLPSGLFVLRPTHFNTPTNGLDYSAEGSSESGEHVTRMMGRNRSFEQLIARIYVCGQSQIVFPAIVPKDHFDYLFTILDNHARERFEAVIKNKLGYVASWQEHNTEVFLLKVQTPNSPGLKPGGPSNNFPIRQNSQNQLEFRNRSLLDLAHEIETLAGIPVMDETGLTNSFNFDLDCTQADLANRNWDNVNQALDRLGLELVSTNMPMNLLVVEKVQ